MNSCGDKLHLALPGHVYLHHPHARRQLLLLLLMLLRDLREHVILQVVGRVHHVVNKPVLSAALADLERPRMLRKHHAIQKRL